jgi:hypothetical protein
MAKPKPVPKPQRPEEHVIESQSENYVLKFFTDKGHTATPLRHDYGTDLLVETFDEAGHIENGFIRVQLKAGNKLRYSKDGSYISFDIEAKHYHMWIEEEFPVFLILYDAHKVAAYYLYVQEYFGKAKKPRKDAKTITVRVPVKNKFTKRAVDYMQERKAAVRAQIRGKIKHEA